MLSRAMKQRFIGEFFNRPSRRPIHRNVLNFCSHQLVGAVSFCLRRTLYPTHMRDDEWHSWDPTPWQHPWQSPDNISSFRIFSEQQIERARDFAQMFESKPVNLGAVCNMANNIYQRLPALKNLGVQPMLYQHPQDTHFMSFPGWEDYDGTLSDDETVYSKIKDQLPPINGMHQFPISNDIEKADLEWIRLSDAAQWPEWLVYNAELCRSLQKHDVLWATQAPYIAYLTNRPYIVTQSGGDAWFDCSRNDSYGQVQRHSFGHAASFFMNNSWSLGFARRYGWRNLLYLPFYLDDEKYTPNVSAFREEWKEQTGGDFFILSTSRLSAKFKRNIDFCECLKIIFEKHPNVRLVQTVWGDGADEYVKLLKEHDILDKVILLPLSGKKRVVQYLQAADCLLDQFQIGYMGATALEGMGCGLPVVMRLEVDQYEALTGQQKSPICHAADEDEVLKQLLHLIEDEHYRNDIAAKHRAWFMRHHSAKTWAPVYRDVLTAVANGFDFDYSQSPLQSDLSDEEIDYHRHGLSVAPEFPQYLL